MNYCVYCGNELHELNHHLYTKEREDHTIMHCGHCDRCFQIEELLSGLPDDEGPNDVTVSIWLSPAGCRCP